MQHYPRSQGELIRFVRSDLTQAEFAKILGVERSCLSRYESEALGAPASVISYCLASLARKAESKAGQAWPIAEALESARDTVAALERLQGLPEPSRIRKATRRRGSDDRR